VPGLLPDLDPYIHAARGLGGGVGAAAEMLPASDLERALEVGGPLLGMARKYPKRHKPGNLEARKLTPRYSPYSETQFS